MPEIDCLFGVPQPQQHHPRDRYRRACDDDPAAGSAAQCRRSGALGNSLHNLGKGTTPADILPSHHGHEERGAALVETLCARLRVPREHRELAVLVARLHTRVHRALELKSSTIVRLLADADALRRAPRFEQLLEACLLDATGHLRTKDRAYPQAERLRAALKVVAAVSPQPLLAKGIKGPDLAGALEQARIGEQRRRF